MNDIKSFSDISNLQIMNLNLKQRKMNIDTANFFARKHQKYSYRPYAGIYSNS